MPAGSHRTCSPQSERFLTLYDLAYSAAQTGRCIPHHPPNFQRCHIFPYNVGPYMLNFAYSASHGCFRMLLACQKPTTTIHPLTLAGSAFVPTRTRTTCLTSWKWLGRCSGRTLTTRPQWCCTGLVRWLRCGSPALSWEPSTACPW